MIQHAVGMLCQDASLARNRAAGVVISSLFLHNWICIAEQGSVEVALGARSRISRLQLCVVFASFKWLRQFKGRRDSGFGWTFSRLAIWFVDLPIKDTELKEQQDKTLCFVSRTTWQA
jgi:hypothetical protein